jgi:hypothetical protein
MSINDVKDRFYGELECVFNNILEYHTNILLGDFKAKVDGEHYSHQQLGMKVHTKLVMVMELS